jgi:hypothetical protein
MVAPATHDAPNLKTSLMALRDKGLDEVLFKEYSSWARHHHTLIWASAAFGTTVQATILLLYDQLDQISYTVAACGGLLLLLATHKLAEGNRGQWADYKSVANLIEENWNLRKAGHSGQLNVISRERPSVQTWRTFLYFVLAGILVVTVAAKWVDQTENQTRNPSKVAPSSP